MPPTATAMKDRHISTPVIFCAGARRRSSTIDFGVGGVDGSHPADRNRFDDANQRLAPPLVIGENELERALDTMNALPGE
jgi:hypothetical protein